MRYVVRGIVAVAVVASAVGFSSRQADAQARLDLFASGFVNPLFVTAPPVSNQVFVVERAGRIRVVNNGVTSTFLDISALTRTDSGSEYGLLGLAFAPDYATSGRFYVNYSDRTTGNTILARYTVSADPNVANTSGQVIYTVTQPSTTNHKAGWIGFRPGDNTNLYVATGDGGGANDPNNNAQNLNSQLGKILRLDVSGTGNATPAAGNPFAGGATADDAVWAFGLRNPYRNSFDRLTGRFLIADVGQDRREEVNVEPVGVSGRNYGWRVREGLIQNPQYPTAPTPPNAVNPIFDYAHGGSFAPAGSASITGGYVYRGPYAEYFGQYLFGDFVNGTFGTLRLDPDTNALVSFLDITSVLNPGRTLFGNGSIGSFGEDAVGNLYVANYSTGNVYRLTGTALVPEPSGLIALLCPAALLLRRRR